jgi:hypothetical protein
LKHNNDFIINMNYLSRRLTCAGQAPNRKSESADAKAGRGEAERAGTRGARRGRAAAAVASRR